MPAQFVPLWQYWWTGAGFMSTSSTSISSDTCPMPTYKTPTHPTQIPNQRKYFFSDHSVAEKKAKKQKLIKVRDIFFWHFSTKPPLLHNLFDIILGYSNSVHQLTVKLQSQISEESSVRESSDCGWWTIYSSCLSLLSTFSQNYLEPKVSSSASAIV